MQLEIGSVVEGVVTGLTSFGAFVSLPGGKSGMVHISKVSTEYVRDIRDHLTEGQQVKVKILSISEDGKIALAIKKDGDDAASPRVHRPRSNRQPNVWQGHQQRQNSGDKMSFEDMMAKFKQESDEKMSAYKKSESRYSVSRRGNSNKG